MRFEDVLDIKPIPVKIINNKLYPEKNLYIDSPIHDLIAMALGIVKALNPEKAGVTITYEYNRECSMDIEMPDGEYEYTDMFSPGIAAGIMILNEYGYTQQYQYKHSCTFFGVEPGFRITPISAEEFPGEYHEPDKPVTSKNDVYINFCITPEQIQ